MDLAGATWPEVDATARTRLLAIPVGSLEQHGPHLSLDTDTRIAVALAQQLAGARSDVVVAPAVPYGASGEHAAFPGTMLVGHHVLADFLVELVRSGRGSFTGTVFVSGHGGNREALSSVEHRCGDEGDVVLVWSPSVPGGDAHAGRTETSLMLALHPETVRLHLAAAGCTSPLEEILPRLRAEGVRPVASNGVLGDPDGASAEEGAALLRSLTADLLGAVAAVWGPAA